MDDDFRITKCITIQTHGQNRPSGKANLHNSTWMQYFHVSSGRAQRLSELPDIGHVLLHIDIPNQQVYPLPLLFTPASCIYLVAFNLPEGKEEGKKALKAIRDTLEDVYAYSSCLCEESDLGMELDSTKQEVFLVGLQREEKDRSSFSEDLNQMLATRSYEKLIVRTESNVPYWTHLGTELNIHDNAALLCRIQGSCCSPTQLIRQPLAFYRELLLKYKDNPFVLCKDAGALAIPDSSNLEQSLNVLHCFGFILYCSLPNLEQAKNVVVLQPQYLRQLFVQVLEQSKDREWFTIADLLRTAGEHIRGKKEWFVAMCTSMGLVIERSIKGRPTHVFVMGLKRECNLPERAHYSVDPLLVTYGPEDMEQRDDDYLLPSPLFPTFVTTFLQTLHKQLKKIIAMKRHYLHVSVQDSTQIHVVERDAFIEVGLQKFHVNDLTEGEQLEKLQQLCQAIYSIVSKSAKSATDSLRLDGDSLQYGFVCHPESNKPVDRFGKFDSHYVTLTCSCCKAPEAPTPQQKIWFSNVDHEKVCYALCM